MPAGLLLVDLSSNLKQALSCYTVGRQLSGPAYHSPVFSIFWGLAKLKEHDTEMPLCGNKFGKRFREERKFTPRLISVEAVRNVWLMYFFFKYLTLFHLIRLRTPIQYLCVN